MALAARVDPRSYRLPWYVIVFGDLDPNSRRSFVAAALLGLALLGGVALAPDIAVEEVPELEAMPERFAKLILEKPAPPAAKPPVTVQAPPEFAEALPQARAPAAPKPKRPTPARTERRAENIPKLAPDQGRVGREQARAVTAALAQSTATLDKTLAEIGQALPMAESTRKPAARGRRSRLRRGAARGELAQVDGGVSAAAQAESGPVVLAAGLSVDLGESGSTLYGAADTRGGQGETAAELRSSASLLAVMQRYAPGVRYCYDSALKRRPDLAGKLVLRLTVAATGSVNDVAVVEDSLNDAAVRDCVLAQVAAWCFEAISAGEVSFRAPLVFTAGD